ncbi:hypothetical protein FB45DRAFT_1104716 [Roridomyces roridus]|uniref:Uncharacterized protein n=1 Tax=Roridomyces roridus TaxID=1738132 RepID=A0AAD7BD96_9AGAR|nr:hypothetical protein FB45DRAFT_1104716 [Roridomyces roridus]
MNPHSLAVAGLSSEQTLVRAFLGPWLVGGCLDLLFMGVLGCQLVNYYNWYKDDSINLRLTVAMLALLNVLKSAECFASLWIFLINHYGDINTALAMSSRMESKNNLL